MEVIAKCTMPHRKEWVGPSAYPSINTFLHWFHWANAVSTTGILHFIQLPGCIWCVIYAMYEAGWHMANRMSLKVKLQCKVAEQRTIFSTICWQIRVASTKLEVHVRLPDTCMEDVRINTMHKILEMFDDARYLIFTNLGTSQTKIEADAATNACTSADCMKPSVVSVN